MGDVSAEPSMEDILSSIKRIIAEEGDDRPVRPKRVPMRAVSNHAIDDEGEEVLELSDPMPPRMAASTHSSSSSSATASSQAHPSNGHGSNGLGANGHGANGQGSNAKASAGPACSQHASPTAADEDDEPVPTIVSQQTAQATRGALDALSRLMVKPETPSDGTLEGLVREMLRPMLRDWLDANLPGMVESLVAREIAKITRGG